MTDLNMYNLNIDVGTIPIQPPNPHVSWKIEMSNVRFDILVR